VTVAETMTSVKELYMHFRFRAGIPIDYVEAMLRPLNLSLRARRLSLRARSRWQMAIKAIIGAFISNGPDRRHINRISRGLPFNHPSRVWKNSVQRPAPLYFGGIDLPMRTEDNILQ
jgi:hypothetical protein